MSPDAAAGSGVALANNLLAICIKKRGGIHRVLLPAALLILTDRNILHCHCRLPEYRYSQYHHFCPDEKHTGALHWLPRSVPHFPYHCGANHWYSADSSFPPLKTHRLLDTRSYSWKRIYLYQHHPDWDPQTASGVGVPPLSLMQLPQHAENIMGRISAIVSPIFSTILELVKVFDPPTLDIRNSILWATYMCINSVPFLTDLQIIASGTAHRPYHRWLISGKKRHKSGDPGFCLHLIDNTCLPQTGLGSGLRLSTITATKEPTVCTFLPVKVIYSWP